MPARAQWVLLSLAYVALRLFSLFFGPPTPLFAGTLLNDLAAFIFFGFTLFSFVRRSGRVWQYSELGWYLVAGELILGGAGGFFQYAGISLRTWLLVASMAIYFALKIVKRELKPLLKTEKYFVMALLLVFFAVALSAARGLVNGHGLGAVLADTIPYAFLLYYFPLKELLAQAEFKKFLLRALSVAIVGNAIFILITFGLFATGATVMQGTYYHWFRDVALGKITELPFYFYRLVLNEHLLLVPAMLYFAWRVLKREAQKYEYGILAASLFILSISVTRIYILALGAGLVTLATRHEWKRWLVVCAGILASFVGIFTFVHLAASRGQSLGWELFGVRLQSIVTPAIEDSALSRLLLLPKILEKIKAHPLLGTGLGDTVTVYSPVFKANITTPHFDWGYLEILAELGLLGGVAWLTFLYRIGARLWATTRPAWQHAALASILVINLTSPALFHALGIVLLVLLAA